MNLLKANDSQLPKHVVIVMDGNGRWAKAKGLNRLKGHQAGTKTVKKIVAYAAKSGIKNLSLFAFSSENWKRPAAEVNLLLNLISSTLKKILNELHQANIKLTFIGDRQAFIKKMQLILENAEELTKNNQQMTLNVAINYGGRWDILQAIKKVLHKCHQQNIAKEKIDEKMLSKEMCLAQLPAPDLFIRTSGEYRISNFFLWQLSQTQLYFCHKYWPDFNEQEFDNAIKWWQQSSSSQP